MTDPRTPVIVGVGQVSQHEDDPTTAREPLALLEDAAAAAARDAGPGTGRALLDRVDSVAVVEILTWNYPDAGAALARRLQIAPRATVATHTGGNSPQMLLNEMCTRVAGGTTDVVLLGGAECLRTRRHARREPRTWLDWSKEADPPCSDVLGTDRDGSSPTEKELGLDRPLVVYPLVDTAQRRAEGCSVADHRDRTADLYAEFSQIAAANPDAWSTTEWSAHEIATPGPDNRMAVAPYTKRMCANETVDMAAALLLSSYEAATAAGVPRDKMVFPLAGADGVEVWNVTERPSLAESPALGATAHAALGALGVDVDAVSRFDLYSCFPSAVRAAMDALALSGAANGDERPLSVTGGLSFAGGPISNYATHSIASMVEACREDPGSIGMTTALGWYLTKHATGLYSSAPPTGGWRQAVADDSHLARTRTLLPPGEVGDRELTIEATAVVMDRDGSPRHALISALTDEGSRIVTRTDRADTCASMVEEAWEGRRIRVGDLG